jgi:SPP1 gp7 family putative phage head morphogenesis protein
MNGKDWQPKRRVEEQYYSDIRQILKKAFSGQNVNLLDVAEFVRKYSWQAARRMVTGLLYDGANTWRSAARESMQGARIYRALRNELSGPIGERVRALITANARLISSLPSEVAEQVAQKLGEAQQAGERSEGFVSELLAGLSRSRARLIARTEISKASTALTQARSEELGLQWWVWQTSRDQRVRASHRKMQGVLCSWNDLPSPEQLVGEKSHGHYAAGNIYNCRCYPEPLLYLDQLSWPHRTYRAGSIRYVTRAEFARVSRIQIHQEAA